MTIKGSSATHTPTEQKAEQGESTDANIYGKYGREKNSKE
jgi:hypothetical protein